MKRNIFKRVGITKLGFVLLLTFAISACAGISKYSDASISWKEEVLLHDGNKIISHRFYNIAGSHDVYPGMALNETVKFNLLDGKSVIWGNDFRDSAPERNSLSHFRFDIVNGVPYLATYTAGCIAYNKWNRPNPPQVFLKYTNNQWQRIMLTDLPPELVNAKANVIEGRPDRNQLKAFYNVAEVNEKNSLIRVLEYKTILKKPVSAGALGTDGSSVNCPNLIRTGDGWKSVDWFSKKPSLEACLNFCTKEKVDSKNCPCNQIFEVK